MKSSPIGMMHNSQVIDFVWRIGSFFEPPCPPSQRSDTRPNFSPPVCGVGDFEIPACRQDKCWSNQVGQRYFVCDADSLERIHPPTMRAKEIVLQCSDVGVKEFLHGPFTPMSHDPILCIV